MEYGIIKPFLQYRLPIASSWLVVQIHVRCLYSATATAKACVQNIKDFLQNLGCF
jgi:hypothetical protein